MLKSKENAAILPHFPEKNQGVMTFFVGKMTLIYSPNSTRFNISVSELF